jgi:glycosyltransferase involved in cell wall biosynthesis
MADDNKKIKIMTLSDHPLAPSGVGIQTKYFIEAMLDTGKYEFISLAGATKPKDMTPIMTEKYGDEWKIFPVEGFGTQEMVRSIMRTEKPDIMWIMTDPRFWAWLWHIDDEIRANMPIVYYHVWDNYPYPEFNKKFYESNDLIVSVSKVTSDIVQTVAPSVKECYIPHTVDMEIFKKLDEEEIAMFRAAHFSDTDDRFIFFWNNRNAKRKQSNSVVWWFKEFLDEIGHDKACLLMHTDPKDPHGPDLETVLDHIGLNQGEVMISPMKYPPEKMAYLYNIADCTINIADAEGFGLSTFESLACETPIIVTLTGGLQEQVTDGTQTFGVGIEPSSKAVIGSQEVPYIFEDRISKDDFISALKEMYNAGPEKLQEIGSLGRKHLETNYNFSDFAKKWDDVLTTLHEEAGSWASRTNYACWELKEVG